MLSTQSGIRDSVLVDAVGVVRRRVVANRWLGLWLLCCNGMLAAMLIALALVHSMRAPLIAGAAVIFLGAIATGIAAWQTRPSVYGLAQRLDQASHLGDRVSTAVHFWSEPRPDEIILRQRGDALAHLAKVQPTELFPIHLPAKMWRTWALLAALAALIAYHAAFGPPIPQLKEKAAQSSALATLVSPLTRALELARAEKKELASLIASNDKEKEATEAQKPLELPPTGQPTDAAQMNANASTFDMAQAMQAPSVNGMPQSKSANPLQGQPGQPTTSPSNSQSSDASAGEPGEEASAQNQQSLAQRAMQAMQNLMNGAMAGQQQGNSQQQNSSQQSPEAATGMQSMSGAAQASNSPNQGAQGQSSNSQNSQNPAQNGPGKHTGAGNGTSPWQPHANGDPQLAGNMSKEHVELQTTGFRGAPGKDRSDVGAGTAQVPMQNVAPQTVTTVNGAGQDSVPPRYRQYVQDYFQHGEK
jgi:hypothetical protein